ncbi:hypothetical protein [Lysinibacillus sp. NPDC086135]|uniref:hypothetical protein n=1 Tax=Lysinibacillus sp. NPDC086135 TaxID=3364130 RepID=UPI00381952A0
MILLLLALFIVFYVAPALISYLGIRWQYQNEWKGLEPELDSFIMVFTPVLNWAYSIFIMMDLLFKSLDETADNMDKSKLNNAIKDKKIGSKFFGVK